MRSIEKLIISNEAGDALEFSARSVFHCNISKDVTGLSDVENDVFSASGIGQTGETYLGYHILPRRLHITGHIKSLDKTAVREYRHRLNHLLAPDSELKILYEHGNYRRKIFGRTDSAPQFSAKNLFPEFALDLLCLDPFWLDENETCTQIATWVGDMIFDSVSGLTLGKTEDDKRWEIGNRSPNLIVHIVNAGDAGAGLSIRFQSQGEVVNPGIMDVASRQFIRFSKTLVYGEELIIKTGYGEKSAVYVAANGAVSDAFQYLDIESSFLQLAVGDNPLRYFAQSGEGSLNVSVNYSNRYLGV